MHRFWAKTNAGAEGAPWKPVGHHGLDVAACAFAFLSANPARLKREAALSGLDPDRHADLCALLAALHDLGKVSRVFQAKYPALWPEAVLGPLPETLPQRINHWEATAILLNARKVRQALRPALGEEALDGQIVAAVAGHHGVAPGETVSEFGDAARCGEIGEPCVAAAAALCGEMLALFSQLRGVEAYAFPETLSFALNGLITLSDWVGSDTAFFAFEEPALPLAAYWPLAKQRARNALAAKGLIPTAPVSEVSLARIAANVQDSRPMQALAARLLLPAEPQIVLIEDGTGSGKTEAGLVLAGRMIAAGLGEGVLVSLPTMATANAMHHRLDGAKAGLFAGSASLVLAHGKAGLAQALDRLEAHHGGNGEESVAARLNDWIGDSRKKAFYADLGAATIDQAFLSVLPKKHLSLRQYALAGRILIVDEAHACDAYMGEELRALVDMQARLGGSVVILSATLGEKMRNDVLTAFAQGRGAKSFAPPQDGAFAPYPLLTRWSAATGVERHAVPATEALSRRVGISRVGSRQDSVGVALEAAGKGAAVAIICNAVDSAIATWRALGDAGHGERSHLFHARFVADDRLAIEERVQRWFGRDSAPEDRHGRILVATQVVEQSLDLDFDLMISDLAPADLIVQRAGRLWRHARQDRPLDRPVLRLLTPDPAATRDAQWLKDTLGPASYVYDMPGVMWRTARDLLAKGRLDTPDDLRRLIETAYDKREDDLPEALRNGHSRSCGEDYAKRSLGRHNVICPGNGYMALSALSKDEDVGTRLGEKSVTLRLARREGAALVPLCRRAGADDRLNWALSEIAVRASWLKRLAGGADAVPADEALVAATKAQWPEWEQTIALFEVDGQGRLRIAGETAVVYDGEAGLRT